MQKNDSNILSIHKSGLRYSKHTQKLIQNQR